MAMDDLLKGLAVFQQGLKQYQTAQAVNDANEQMLALNTQEMDREQALSAQNQISSSLAMRLGAAGADASQIQALTSEIAPSRGAQFQADSNQELQTNSQDFQSSEKQKDRDHALQLKRMELDAIKSKADRKMTDKEMAFIKGHSKDFDSQAKKSLEALNQLTLAKDALASNNPIADKSVVNFLVKASGEVGAMTEADKKPFGGSMAYTSQAKQFTENARSGKFTPENRKFVEQLVGVYEKAQNKNVIATRDRIAQRAATQAGRGGFNLDQAQIAEMLYASPKQQLTDKQKQDQAKAQEISAARQWLLSDAAKKDPKKAAAVLKHVNFLEGKN